MQKMNWTRVIVGGLLAGLVINICEFLVNGLLLGNQWAAAMKALNRPEQMGVTVELAFWLAGFAIGLYAVWLYVNLRLHFGPGPRTAVIAGIAVWILGSLIASVAPVALHLFPYRLMAIGLLLALVETIAGTWLGAWMYKDQPAVLPAQATGA